MYTQLICGTVLTGGALCNESHGHVGPHSYSFDRQPASQPSTAGADARGLAGQIRFPNLMEWQWRETPWMLKEVERIAALLESFRNKPVVISADARELAEKIEKALIPKCFPMTPRDDAEACVTLADLMDELPALLESFRAATLEQAAQIADACQKDATGDVHNVYANLAWIAPRIRALSPSPNWLARQIAAARMSQLIAVAGYLPEGEFNARKEALESASAKLKTLAQDRTVPDATGFSVDEGVKSQGF